MQAPLPNCPSIPAPIEPLDMESFMNFCSFGKLHMLNHNLGGGIDADDDDIDADLVVEQPKVLLPTWVDSAPSVESKVTALVDEEQVKEWLESKMDDKKKKKKKQEKREESAPSNSFFSQIEGGKNKKVKKEKEQPKAQQKKQLATKSAFLDMLKK
jgi:hypothetical protein